MKFFRTSQIRKIDADTINNEPISSIDLMERASRRLTDAIVKMHGGRSAFFAIFAGAGNNGGDALAVARMLHECGQDVAVWLVASGASLSPDCAINLERLNAVNVNVEIVNDIFSPPSLPHQTIIIDGLFGSGLSRAVEGLCAEVINYINSTGLRVISLDIPSGLPGEKHFCSNVRNIVCAHTTLTLQFPKLSFLLPGNEQYVGDWQIVDIGLHPQAIEQQCTNFYFTQKEDIKKLLLPRKKFSHKGDYGRALLFAGSLGMAGASVLSARAALRSGVGLLTLAVPSCNNTIVQAAVPEAMTLPMCGDEHISFLPSIVRYCAVGVGPGIGTHEETERLLLKLIEQCKVPMVLDADALNILSKHHEIFSQLPKNSILTPHVGEFTRMAGEFSDSYDRLMAAIDFACRHKVCVVLKGAYTAVCSPSGDCYFNSSGNPGMATGGSGDVLTGIAVSLLARGYSVVDAARIAVYIHGLAGDIASAKYGETAMTAGDIVNALPSAWKSMEDKF